MGEIENRRFLRHLFKYYPVLSTNLSKRKTSFERIKFFKLNDKNDIYPASFLLSWDLFFVQLHSFCLLLIFPSLLALCPYMTFDTLPPDFKNEEFRVFRGESDKATCCSTLPFPHH